MIKKTESEIMKTWISDADLPVVSICSLAFNHENYIEEALDSFLMQITRFPFEIIIHDDASTDKTKDIIKSYEKRFPNIIRAIYQSENQYSRGNRPSLIVYKKARGEFLALCEADDFWCDPYKLEKQITVMIEHPGVNFSFHGSIRHNSITNQKNLTGDASKIIDNLGESAFAEKNRVNTSHKYGYTESIQFNKSYSMVIPTENIILKTFYGGVETSSCVVRSCMTEKIIELFETHPYLPFGDFYIQILSSYPNGALYINNVMSIYRQFSNPNSYTWKLQEKDSEAEHYNKFLPTIKILDQITNFKHTKELSDFFHKRMYRAYCSSLDKCVYYKKYQSIFTNLIDELNSTEEDYILFGYGVLGKIIYQIIEQKIHFIIDDYLNSDLFRSPEKLLNTESENDINKLLNYNLRIIISPLANQEEIAVKLSRLGVNRERLIMLTEMMPNYLKIL